MTMKISPDKWFVFHRCNSEATLRLFCFPYSGSGAFAYQPWVNRLPDYVELCAVQLPGRENRMKEPLYKQVEPLVEAMMAGIRPYLDKPIALFGHSLGALVAFETTRYLRSQFQIIPQHLFVSARVAPQFPQRESPMYCLPDADFKERLQRFNGTTESVLNNGELMNILLPLLRADFEMNETYIYEDAPPLDCPISAFRGASDAIVTYEGVAAWGKQTTNAFTLRTLPGDHFFIHTAGETFWQIFLYDLRQTARKVA